MVNIPTNSPIHLIEFELIAFKNALANQSDDPNSKTVLIFPNNLDPVINRLIRFLASRMHLDSMLIGDYESEVVAVYPEHYFREGEPLQEKEEITTEDFLSAKSLVVSGSEQGTELELAQPSTSSAASSIPARLDLAIKKGDGEIETKLKQSTTSKSFEYGEQYPDLTSEQKKIEQPVRGKRKAKTKWIDSMKELSLSSTTSPPPTSPPPLNLDAFRFSDEFDVCPPFTSTPEISQAIEASPDEESNWTEGWGTHEAVLLPLGYMQNLAPELLTLFPERVPGTVCYLDKQGHPLEFPATIYIMPPKETKDTGSNSPSPGPSRP